MIDSDSLPKGKTKKATIDEVIIYEDIKSMLKEAVAALKASKERDEDAMKQLYQLARIYAVLKDDFRMDVKEDIFSKLGVEN